jgi:hypothetical protein
MSTGEGNNITCPYCSKVLECKKGKELKALTGHYNHSKQCKGKRPLPFDGTVRRPGKLSRDEAIVECLEESVQFSNVGVEGKEVRDVPMDYGYWFDDDVQSASNSMHESSKVPGCFTQSISDEEDGSFDMPDHVSVDSTLDAVEVEDIVDFEVLSDLVEKGIGIIIGTTVVDDDPEEMEQEFFDEDVIVGASVVKGSRLTKSEFECSTNEIKLKQELTKHLFYDNMPAKFNRVCGEDVNLEIAIQCLNHMVELHMSESEADDFLALMDRVVSSQTGKFFPMPIRSKTLSRAFLGKADKFFPLEESFVKILPDLFDEGEITPMCKPMIKLEDAFSMLFLKINPDDLSKDSTPIFEEVNGEEQRLYGGFCSGDYSIEIQKQIYESCEEDENGRRPLVVYVSTWIDSGLMNSTHTRSTTPIVLTVLNDSCKNSALIGFCAKSLHITDEFLEQLLQRKGLKGKSNKEQMKKLALRQANWDYCYSIIGAFQDRQKERKGFEVQIGLGPSAEYHKVFVVFSNCLGDHPQIHEMTGVKSNACHICTNMHPFNFPVNDMNRNGCGSIQEKHTVRLPLRQYLSSRKHFEKSLAVVKYASDLNKVLLSKADKEKIAWRLKKAKLQLKAAKEELDNTNSRSGDITPYLFFKDFLQSGSVLLLLSFWKELI